MTRGISVPKWFPLLGIVLLLWGAAGVFAFYSQLTTPYETMVADIGKPAADCIRGMPAWLWWIYGIAVWSAVFGAIALLLRRTWAQPLYLLSMVSVIVQFGHSFLVQKIHVILGPSAAIFPAFIIAMAIFQLWFTTAAKKKGWLR